MAWMITSLCPVPGVGAGSNHRCMGPDKRTTEDFQAIVSSPRSESLSTSSSSMPGTSSLTRTEDLYSCHRPPDADGVYRHIAFSIKSGTRGSTSMVIWLDRTTHLHHNHSYIEPPDRLWLPGRQILHGAIDEVEIFDRALSASEIQAIFDAGAAAKCRLPVADAGPDSSATKRRSSRWMAPQAAIRLGSPHLLLEPDCRPVGDTHRSDSPMASFTAPPVPAGGATLSFQLVVTSPLGRAHPMRSMSP